MSDAKRFPMWLRDQLTRRGMSEADLARALSTTASVVNRWVRGERVPSPESCERLADVWGLSVDTVLTVAGHRPAVGPLAPDDPRVELHDMVDRIVLGVDNREETLRGILETWLRQDRNRRQYIADEGDDGGVVARDNTAVLAQ